ncbi:DNA methyltransferase [Hippea alviniae]|uniref:DNA methyltransferase n=1 Tax=Hippea alviniae TaxID=1279027 RepID=UPI0003B7A3EC|nr:site-specific DNA-methyltransferase [Hippea alviniae]
MASIFNELKDIFIKDKTFIDSQGNLLKNKIVESALKLDENLIKLLLQNDRIKKHFFKDINGVGVIVFDKEKFMKFIDNKEFLPDSYTAFKNKIGLANEEGKYLAKSKEVVLVWPYKDCVLEGGQGKPDEKRREIFHNVILAPDEIDRLLEPKVFTNFKRIDKDGEHPLDEFKRDAEINRKRGLPEDTITDNLVIKGNNLLVLHSLLKEFRGKVKLIYIDPPYNTGSDEFQYNDNFKHSTWLTFMKNRLEVAKELLREDGAIFVQLDDNEHAYLKVLMDEIFGRENFRENIVVKTSTPSGVNAINVKRGERLFKLKEYILFYSKKPSFRFNPLYVKSKFNINYRYEITKENGKYIIKDLMKVFKDITKLEEYALNNFEKIYSLEKNNKKAGEKIKKVIQESKNLDDVIEYINTKGEKVLIYKGGVFIPLKERIVKENGKNYFGTLISDLWDDEIFQTNSTEGGVNLPGGKKPEKLLKRVLELTTKENDIILDFFMGTGTTCAVAHKMNRQYIGIEQIDYSKNSAVVRLKNVINGDKTGISKDVNWEGGGEFVFMELMKNNEAFIEKIEEAQTETELLKIWIDMKQHSFLSYKVNIKLFEKNIEKLKKFDLGKQKRILLDFLEYNELYVNYSEINDSIYNINKKDKMLNYNFYEGRAI